MALPAQVEKDLKDVEEMEKQMAAQSAPADDGLGESAEETASEQEQDVVEVDDPPAKEKEVSQVEAKEDFEHKYRTLQGKYDAEVPRLHSQVKELLQKVDDLTQALEAKPQTPETPPEPETYVTDADREAFGEDLLDVQRRVAKEVAGQYERKIAKLESTIDSLTKRIDGTDNSVTELTFEQRLGRLVPDFDTINRDPEWFAWLDEHDPIIRGPRRMLAQRAFESGDAEAVADYVKLFKASQAPAQESQDRQSSRKTELEKQVWSPRLKF